MFSVRLDEVPHAAQASQRLGLVPRGLNLCRVCSPLGSRMNGQKTTRLSGLPNGINSTAEPTVEFIPFDRRVEETRRPNRPSSSFLAAAERQSSGIDSTAESTVDFIPLDRRAE